MSIAWNDIEDAIFKWFIEGSGLPAVVWGNQDGPQPVQPYGTLLIAGPRKVGGLDQQVDVTDLDQPAGEEVSQTLTGIREVTVSCQAFAAPTVGSTPARSYLSNALMSLELPTIRQRLINAGLSVIEANDITDVSALMGTRWQSRAAMDVRFHLVDSAVEKTGYIAMVEVSNTLTP